MVNDQHAPEMARLDLPAPSFCWGIGSTMTSDMCRARDNILIKLHIFAQSGPNILIFQCYTYGSTLRRISCRSLCVFELASAW